MKIYRLITRNSYEREMFDKASLKLGLDKAVLQSMSGRENANSGVQQLSKKEIEDLLRKGAYGALMDEEDEGSKFCEEDIDQILQRRTHTITIESEGKGSTFAKVTAPHAELRHAASPSPGEVTPVHPPVCRPASWPLGTARTYPWRIQTSGRSGPRRPSWTWMPSTDGYWGNPGGGHSHLTCSRRRPTCAFHLQSGDVSAGRPDFRRLFEG